MSDKTIVILSLDIFIFILLLKIVFGSFKRIKSCFYYLIKPDIVSIIDKEYDNDFNYTHKFLFVVIIMLIIGFAEFYLFYD
jgi:hypothetical protein